TVPCPCARVGKPRRTLDLPDGAVCGCAAGDPGMPRLPTARMLFPARKDFMNINELKELLAEHPGHVVRFTLPTGSSVPPHAHVTEVARIDKRFIDCGGTARTESVCRLQTWYADDTEHRLTAGKLRKILDLSSEIVQDDSLPVEIEHEAPFISQFPIGNAKLTESSLVFELGVKHTDCLAKESCLPRKPEGVLKFAPLPSLQ